MSKELLNALDALETEKGIKKEVIIDWNRHLFPPTRKTTVRHKTSK